MNSYSEVIDLICHLHSGAICTKKRPTREAILMVGFQAELPLGSLLQITQRWYKDSPTSEYMAMTLGVVKD
jgi:hypothetical protein